MSSGCRGPTEAVALHIERRGDGPPVVFTHGFATSGETWAAQVEALAATHTVVTWDLRGHGRSGPPAGDYTTGRPRP